MDIGKIQLEERLSMMEKKLQLITLIDMPAVIVIGLALFSKFDDDPGALHPILADADIVNSALVIAIPWAVIYAYKSVKQSIEINKLKKIINK